MDIIDRFLAAHAAHAEAKEQLSLAHAEKERMEEAVIAYLLDTGTDSLTRHGKTVSLATTLRAKHPAGGRQDACDALREIGMGDLVSDSFNHNTVSAWMREQPRDEHGKPRLPAALEGRLECASYTEARVRSAGAASSGDRLRDKERADRRAERAEGLPL